MATDGLLGLFLRGLGTKILSNGVQAMLITVMWRYIQELLEKLAEVKRKAAAKEQ